MAYILTKLIDNLLDTAFYNNIFGPVFCPTPTNYFNSPPTEDCSGIAGMPCDENAMCEELVRRDNFTCTCIPPYMGDGFMCSRGKCL